MRNLSLSRTATLVRQIEILKEDNRQLRAAVAIYEEVVRRSEANRRSPGAVESTRDV
jgi:hypothetical protein